MTYIDDLNTGQGAKLKNQDIFGCLFYVRRLDVCILILSLPSGSL